MGSGQADPVPAAARLARTALDGERGRERRRGHDARDQPHGGGRRRRHAAAVGIVPGEAEVAERSRGERQLRLTELLVRQIEEGAFRDQQRPVRAVAAAFQPYAFEERRRQAVDPQPIGRSDLAEVRLEAAFLLSVGVDRGDGKNGRRPPCRFSQRFGHQQVRNFARVGVEETEVAQFPVDAREERHVDGQAARPPAVGGDRALEAERGGRHGLLRGGGRLQHDGRGKNRARQSGPQALSSGDCRTNLCSASATSDSEIASPTSDPTLYKPPSDPMS